MSLFRMSQDCIKAGLWLSLGFFTPPPSKGLKGGCRSHTCDTYMKLNIIEMNRKNFFFHFLILTSSGGLPGKLILAKIIHPVIASEYNFAAVYIHPYSLDYMTDCPVV